MRCALWQTLCRLGAVILMWGVIPHPLVRWVVWVVERVSVSVVVWVAALVGLLGVSLSGVLCGYSSPPRFGIVGCVTPVGEFVGATRAQTSDWSPVDLRLRIIVAPTLVGRQPIWRIRAIFVGVVAHGGLLPVGQGERITANLSDDVSVLIELAPARVVRVQQVPFLFCPRPKAFLRLADRVEFGGDSQPRRGADVGCAGAERLAGLDDIAARAHQ